MQAWLSRAFPERSPYGFYALSNLGSMLALLSYPFLFEPAIDLKMQSMLWCWLFGLFAALNIIYTVAFWSNEAFKTRETIVVHFPLSGHPELPPSWSHRIQWLVLTACASLMLLATTNMVCQDIAVVPLLWVLPLSLYLLSFIICFGRARWYHQKAWGLLTVLVFCLLSCRELLEGFGYSIHLLGESVLYFAALFAVCMVCHGECLRLSPEAEYLTEFYLYIGLGGALGGLAAGLVAPNLFRSYLEWKIGVIASFAVALMGLIRSSAEGYGKVRFLSLLFAFPTTFLGVFHLLSSDRDPAGLIETTRNFYGVVAVYEQNSVDCSRHQMIMKHGTTSHGGQFIAALKKRWPTAYYGEQSGVGRTIGYYLKQKSMRVGIVGLGVGTLASYSRPEDEYRFYEINPEVLRMGRQYFTYLDDCRGNCEVVLGDGRVSLERDPPQNFDVLVLDAFSSDAIPVHLLTREAFALYRKHLAPGGAIAVHITNRYLRLAPVLQGIAEHFGLKTARIINKEDEDRMVYDADWILLTKNEELLKSAPVIMIGEERDEGSVPLWTDHYNSLFPLLKY
jgi:hypothetical protein